MAAESFPAGCARVTLAESKMIVTREQNVVANFIESSFGAIQPQVGSLEKGNERRRECANKIAGSLRRDSSARARPLAFSKRDCADTLPSTDSNAHNCSIAAAVHRAWTSQSSPAVGQGSALPVDREECCPTNDWDRQSGRRKTR